MKKLVSKALKFKTILFGILTIVAVVLLCTKVLASMWYIVVPAVLFVVCLVWLKIDMHNNRPAPISDEALQQYLSQYRCTGCRNRCTLDNVKCSTGKVQRDKQIEQYGVVDNTK